METSARHALTVYETDAHLVDAVGRFIAEGLANGEHVLVFATPDHRAAFEDRAWALGAAVVDAVAARRLVFADAAATLEAIVAGDRIDAERFATLVAGLVPAGVPLRVYGEMVQLLACDGRFDLAMQLEALAPSLTAAPGTRVLCAYHAAALPTTDRLRIVCAAHDATESEPGPYAATVYRAAAAVLAEARDRLETRARRAELRLEVLTAASDALASSLDFETVLRNVVALTRPAFADFGFFDVIDDDDAVRRISDAWRDPRRAAILAASRWQRAHRADLNLCALSSGETALHAPIDDAWYQRVAAGPEHLAVLRALAFRSMITVPMRADGRLIGALTLFHGDSGRQHTRDDVALVEELASRAARAVENARLHRALRREVERREAADRRWDERLAVLVRELRAPLAPMVSALARLKRRGEVGDEPATIEGQVQRLARLVDDLLDASRDTADDVERRREPVEPLAGGAEAAPPPRAGGR